MLKRLLHIALAAWLINTLVCFHPAIADGHNRATCFGTSVSHVDNSLLEIFCNHVLTDKPHEGHRAHHTSPKYRYLVTRNLGFDICGIQLVNFYLFSPEKDLPAFVPGIWENRIFLPKLHGFLFRLSPF